MDSVRLYKAEDDRWKIIVVRDGIATVEYTDFGTNARTMWDYYVRQAKQDEADANRAWKQIKTYPKETKDE